jgi:carbamoyl-phosphate synthase large subunit
LKEEGYDVILANSNPATIMTDPEMAYRTYIEPLTPETMREIIRRERPDALLPTLGGQTGLNIAVTLAELGVLDEFGVELIGAKLDAIKKAEDRILFKRAMEKIEVPTPKSEPVYSVEKALEIAEEVSYPVVVRPSYTLGGTGSGIAYNKDELARIASNGIECSRIGEVLIEESVIGWKEYELEVMRDLMDNVVIICSIENIDPMGIHTGDSICVAPAQTLNDIQYQKMRDYAKDIIREIGVETGGSNIQFAVKDEKMVVIEMNPRVSRSSALASKATGFPIAKIAAKLAVGLTLDEIPNDITRETPASFEPTIDYIVVKMPRFAFDKFPDADRSLGTQMKSVGEVMAIGRTFEEALHKAIRSLEIGRYGLSDGRHFQDDVRDALKIPCDDKIALIYHALSKKMSIEEIYKLTKIDTWFLFKIKKILEMEENLRRYDIHNIPRDVLYEAKRMGFSDLYLSHLLKTDEISVRKMRRECGITPRYKLVDTCAAEFEARTPYYYSSYEEEDEVKRTTQKKIIVLGSGPNRIGQGIEFDYCCVQASLALREEGYETIMVNSNPETVSTDYDVSDRLYFEPLTIEDVLNIVDKERPDGVIVQFGGQTPLNLAVDLERMGVPIVGTSPDSIDIAEDRRRFGALLKRLDITQPEGSSVTSIDEALVVASKISYPVLVRPSYVLGGRAMEIVYDEDSLKRYMEEAIIVSPEKPILIDKFLENAIEVEVDALFDGDDLLIGGIMEHIEEAGVHSGDSACVMPTQSLSSENLKKIRDYTREMASSLSVKGLINIQFAVKDEKVYVLEVNPRASRTVPYISKATGVPLAKIATKVMIGKRLNEMNVKERKIDHVAIKEAVFPFSKLQGVDVVLGPEMKATGEVMGLDVDFGRAFYKAESSAKMELPKNGTVFISVKREYADRIVAISRKIEDLGFRILCTEGTGEILQSVDIPVKIIPKLSEIYRPNVIDYIKSKRIDLIINIPMGKGAKSDGFEIRNTAITYNIPYITTTSGAFAAVEAIESIRNGGDITIKSIQEYHMDRDMYN